MADTASTAIGGSMMIERSSAAYFREEASLAHPREGVVFTLDCHSLKLAHHVRRRFPPTLLLVASDRMSVPAGDMPEHSAYLAKPFDPAAMLRKIEEMTR